MLIHNMANAPASTFRRAKSDSNLLIQPPISSDLSPLTTIPALRYPLRPPSDGYDPETAASFAQTLVSNINDAATCILISLGHQLGLFTALARLTPKAQEPSVIAQAAGNLNVPCVTEWLAAMTCTGILECDSSFSTISCYRLPPEHVPWLVWTSGTNLAHLCQWLPALARIEDPLASCFRTGHGLDDDLYADFDRVTAYDVMQTVGSRIVSILQLAPKLPLELEQGACVLCIGGSAEAVYVRTARMFPSSWFTCYGTDEPHADTVRRTLQQGNVNNVHVKTLASLEDIQERCSFDVVLILEGSIIREHARPISCLNTLRKTLRKNCPLIFVEVMASGDVFKDKHDRISQLTYTMAAMRILPKAIHGGQTAGDAGGLWGHVVVRSALMEAGFVDVQLYGLEDDSLNCVLLASSGSKE